MKSCKFKSISLKQVGSILNACTTRLQSIVSYTQSSTIIASHELNLLSVFYQNHS